MLERLSRLPQIVFIVVLLISLAFLATFVLALGYVNADAANMPIRQLPADYWFMLAVVLVCLPATVVSSYFLGWTKGQTPSSILASMGTLFLGYFLFNIGGGWNGGTLLSAMGAGLFFALALVFRLLQRSKSPS